MAAVSHCLPEEAEAPPSEGAGTLVETPQCESEASFHPVDAVASLLTSEGPCGMVEAFLLVCKRLDAIDHRLEGMHASDRPATQGYVVNNVDVREAQACGDKCAPAHSDRPPRNPRASADVPQTARESGKSNLMSAWNATQRRTSAVEVGHLHMAVSNSYHLTDLQVSRNFCRRWLRQIIDNPLFDVGVTIMILANSAVIGVDTEGYAQNPNHNGQLFEIVSIVFGCVFILEFLIHFFVEGPSTFIFRLNGWKVFDLLIVLESVSSVVLFALEQGHGAAEFQNVRTLRSLKIMKLLRVLRVLKILQFTMALRQLIHGITVALRSLGWATVLLAVLVYIFAVFFTSAMQLHEPDIYAKLEPFFGSIGDASMLLVQSMFGGHSWREVALLLREAGLLYEVAFLIYIAITMLTVLNVVTGVFTTVALKTSETDPELIALNAEVNQRRLDQLALRLFEFLDVDGSGKVTLLELEDAWHKTEFKALLKAIGIDAQDVWLLFSLMDFDSDGLIEFGELCEGVQKLIGNGLSLEMARIQLGQKMLMRKLETMVPEPVVAIRATNRSFKDNGISPQTLPDVSPSMECAL